MASITGTNGNDNLFGTYDADIIYGLGGDDRIVGGLRDDIMFGDAGNDTFVVDGVAGRDSFHGGSGTDRIVMENVASYANEAWLQVQYLSSIEFITNTYFTKDAILISTGSILDLTGVTVSGFDEIRGTDGANHIITSTSGYEFLDGRGGNDILQGNVLADEIRGGSGDDELRGMAGNDTLEGGAGNDILRGDSGADDLNGGAGTDTADYATSSAGVQVDLKNATASLGDAQDDILISIENLAGSAHADDLRGDDGANVVTGGSGDDTMFGRGGDDVLDGGAGNDVIRGQDGADTLYGGAGDDDLKDSGGDDRLDGGTGNDVMRGGSGADSFVFYIGSGQDTVGDWQNGIDRLDFSASGLTYADLAIGTGAGGSAVIDYGGGDQIIVTGAAGQIEASDFVF